MTIAQALDIAASRLQVSCPKPLFEAELLLAHHLGKERLYLHIHGDEVVKDIDGYHQLIRRREAHEPYEYIVGETSFYDLYLSVVPGVLIPRPETELLIDQAAAVIEREGITSLIEIGVGSGAISVVLARKFPQLQIVATDISEDVLLVAQKNIDRYGVAGRVTLLQSNLMDEVTIDAGMVVSNPPYIAEGFRLERNVSDYEPHRALFGGRVGDELLKQIIDDAFKRDIRWLACEMGYDQKRAIQEYVNEIDVEYIDFYQDLAGFDRGFIVRF
ncbi:MAG TPA: peptide chain release factor N(5)-glutamine methyltransferase [Epsilonproteobacteria bacterium]|nr:peptide chain release factor N(5)-glutamine methyltransferase [Campylobacterota bacterium]